MSINFTFIFHNFLSYLVRFQNLHLFSWTLNFNYYFDYFASLHKRVLIFSLSGMPIPSLICCFSLFTIRMAHFSILNSISMSLLYIHTVCIKLSNNIFECCFERIDMYFHSSVLSEYLQLSFHVDYSFGFLVNISLFPYFAPKSLCLPRNRFFVCLRLFSHYL